MALIRNLFILLALVCGPYIYQRYTLIDSLKGNAPGLLQPISAFSSYEIKFADQLRNCEDVILPEGLDGVALLSCDEGRDRWNTVMGIFNPPAPQGQLYLYNYTTPSSQPIALALLDFPDATIDFHPIGIDYHAASATLFVVNHASAGSRIEIFKLWPQDQAATHVRSVVHPDLHSPNALAAASETSLYVTNDHYFPARAHPWLSKLETFLAPASGNVVHFDLLDNAATVLDRIAFANGVVLLNAKTLAVASTNRLEVYIYHIKERKLYLKKTLRVPFLPDNLSVDGHGKLLIAGHPHPFAIGAFAASRDACHSGEGAAREAACGVRAATAVAEWEADGGLRVLWMGEEFATGTTAVRDVGRGVGVVCGLYERGLLLWRE